MAGILDDHGSGYHPVVAAGMGDSDRNMGWFGMIWVLAIIILFFVIIFAWRRDRHDGEGVLPALLAGGLASKGNHDGDYGHSHEHWDMYGAELRETGELKKEAAILAKDQEAITAKYFYDQQTQIQQNRHDAAIGFKDVEVQGLRNKDDLSKQICEMERRLTEKGQEEIIRALTSEVNVLKTVMYQRFGYGMPYPQCG